MAPSEVLDEKSFLPDASLTTNVTGELDGKPKEKEVFTLSHPDILSLMRYVRGGCLLPTTRDEYVRRMEIDPSAVDEVEKEIDLMTATYKDIKTDNINFRDSTWPSLVSLAGKIIEYAKVAGSGINRLQRREAPVPPDEEKMNDAKDGIRDYTSSLIDMVKSLQEASTKAKNDFATFKNLTINHSMNLKDNQAAVKKLLEGSTGDIAILITDIQELQETLATQQHEYSHDVVVSSTTPTYLWCTLFGFIAAIAVGAIYSKRAINMQHAIEATQKKIESDNKKLEAARIVNTDTQRMTIGIDALIALIGPAIETLKKLETVWQTVKDDLQGLYDKASFSPNEIPGLRMERTKVNSMINSWDGLKEQVDLFRKTAYISEPEILTFQDFIDKYGVKE